MRQTRLVGSCMVHQLVVQASMAASRSVAALWLYATTTIIESSWRRLCCRAVEGIVSGMSMVFKDTILQARSAELHLAQSQEKSKNEKDRSKKDNPGEVAGEDKKTDVDGKVSMLEASVRRASAACQFAIFVSRTHSHPCNTGRPSFLHRLLRSPSNE